MEIIDLNNKSIIVTDLEGAIRQAKQFTQYRIVDPEYAALDRGLHAYWQDMLKKLLDLKAQISNKSSP